LESWQWSLPMMFVDPCWRGEAERVLVTSVVVKALRH
jgi:hypothetical protein